MDNPERKSSSTEYDYLFKIILVGAAGVGKTSIIIRYCENSFKLSYGPTLGIDFRIKTIKVKDKVVKLQIWDTAGQERYRAMAPAYFRGCHGYIVIFDLTDRGSLDDAQSYLSKGESDYGIGEGCSLLVGNKSDMEAERKVTRDVGLEIAKSFKTGYVETSAKTAKQVDEVFYSLAESLLEKCEKGELEVEKGPKKMKNIMTADSIDIKRGRGNDKIYTQSNAQGGGCCS